MAQAAKTKIYHLPLGNAGRGFSHCSAGAAHHPTSRRRLRIPFAGVFQPLAAWGYNYPDDAQNPQSTSTVTPCSCSHPAGALYHDNRGRVPTGRGCCSSLPLALKCWLGVLLAGVLVLGLALAILLRHLLSDPRLSPLGYWLTLQFLPVWSRLLLLLLLGLLLAIAGWRRGAAHPLYPSAA